MDLPLFFHGLTRSRGIWPSAAVRPALIAAAAIAGYATFTSLTATQAPGTVAQQPEPEWVGQFAGPVVEATPPSAPATSASYILPDAASTGSLSKKTSTLPAGAPKVVSKTVGTPRHAQLNEEATKVAVSAQASIPAAAIAAPAAPTPPALIPAEAAGPAPRSQNLLSRVTDRLPDRGLLLKPLGLVGDAFHNIVKSF
jgi:hypothetical protein